MLPAQVLAMLRAATAGFLTETCTIEAQSAAYDEYGAPSHAWELVAADVPCRVITQGTERNAAAQVGSQEAIVQRYRLVVPYGTALAVDQRVTVGGVAYNVVALLTDRTDETDRQAMLVRAE